MHKPNQTDMHKPNQTEMHKPNHTGVWQAEQPVLGQTEKGVCVWLGLSTLLPTLLTLSMMIAIIRFRAFVGTQGVANPFFWR
jgi:hypothetical protein